MKPPASEYVTLVEVMELTRPFEEFAQAVRAAARHLEAEGIQELVMLHFYGNPRSTEVGALLTFSDRERMIEHIEMISAWEEFERFFATVKPVDVRVYGELSAEAEEWIGQFDVLSRKFEEHVAGFVRRSRRVIPKPASPGSRTLPSVKEKAWDSSPWGAPFGVYRETRPV